LVSMGCIMMRKCHLNTCPVGIATQDPVLRQKFTGTPENVINFFFYIAEEVRQWMSKLGFRSMEEMVGRVDKVEMRQALDHWKARGLDFSTILYNPQVPRRVGRRCTIAQDHGLENALDHELIAYAQEAIKQCTPVERKMEIRNTHRTVGAMLSGEIARRYGSHGLPEDTIRFDFTGSAGQSFGAFLAKGVTLTLEGDANDYVGKSLSGGVLAVRPPARSSFKAHENVIIGNTCLYGATTGKAFFAGRAGERFAVRNSGAVSVVEGVGDHGCEYMTGGTVVVLGPTGRNFAAGMSGGLAFVLDDERVLAGRVSKAMVDLEPLTPEDEELVQRLVKEHEEHTRSARARYVLSTWSKRRFVKVMPHEWRRVLQSRAQQNAGKVAGAHG